MKGDITVKILELLKSGGRTTAEILDLFLVIENYPSLSFMHHSRRYRRTRHAPSPREIAKNIEYKEFAKLYSMLSYLKKDKLIQKRKGLWFSTKRGREKQKILETKRNWIIPYRKYPKTDDGELKIITFDIPECDKRKRNWLRFILRTLDFQMLHKSVWIGKKNLPQEFIEDLKEKNILDCIEIIAVTKKGSLRRLEQE